MGDNALLVLISDHLSALVRKGEITDRYYNPGDLFDDVHILMANEDRPDPRAVRQTVGRARLHLHNLPTPSFRRTLGWHPYLLGDWLAAGLDLGRRIRPQLIRCHGVFVHTYLAGHLRRLLQVPAVLSIHINPDTDYCRLASSLRAKFVYARAKGLAEAALPLFDHVIGVYSSIRPYLEARRVPRSSIIHNTVGIGANPKTDYRLRDGHVRCVCVGRQDRRERDPRLVLRAVASISEATLHLYGAGDLHEELIALARSLNVTDRVAFSTGIPNEQLMRGLHEFDLYVFNSKNYEVSKTVLEAALVGLPIVHNVRRPALAEELAHGFVWKVEDSPEGYRRGILSLAADQGLRQSLGERARGYAQTHWAPEITEGLTSSLYRSLIS